MDQITDLARSVISTVTFADIIYAAARAVRSNAPAMFQPVVAPPPATVCIACEASPIDYSARLRNSRPEHFVAHSRSVEI